jgi:hypothetical protein
MSPKVVAKRRKTSNVKCMLGVNRVVKAVSTGNFV